MDEFQRFWFDTLRKEVFFRGGDEEAFLNVYQKIHGEMTMIELKRLIEKECPK